MSYVIWDRGDCLIFNSKSETEAMDYIHEAIERDPYISFDGWKQSQSGKNYVALLADYDTVFQFEKHQKYLLPKLETV